MSLFEVYEVIKASIPGFTLQTEMVASSPGDTPHQASNLSELRRNILSVEDIKYVSTEIDLLKKSWLFDTSMDVKRVSTSARSEVQTLLSVIQLKLLTIKDIVEDSYDFDRGDLLFVKLPELKSFDELTRFSNDLKKSIESPILDKDIQGTVEIVSAGNGSVVLYVALGTLVAVKLIAGICWAAAVIRKKAAEAKIFEQHAKTLELKNEALDTIVDAQKAQLKNILDSEAKAIADKHYSHTDNETIERLKLSISTIAELIDKGAKILPMSKDEDIQRAFPDYSRLNLIESTIKQITEGGKQA